MVVHHRAKLKSVDYTEQPLNLELVISQLEKLPHHISFKETSITIMYI